ncbi:hypothetical protein IGI04_011848 [Brassica rapa subsp. trilocularis]|uniref:DC1 domain-containing protein n=1 Tax=Brassica rapa subsp. trilocularis TaxID=1813537 RepID=A0ABQ7N498_BRACM|nr:hypothetical protein IGI04_011848 [Brassica rapa subsp. trilocularis]
MMKIKDGFLSCSKCGRESCGFMYRCATKKNRGNFFKCSFHLKSKSATPVLIKCKFDTHPLTVHYSQLFPRTRWALNYKVCEVIINYQECPTGFVGRYITDVTVSAKTNWFSRIREMIISTHVHCCVCDFRFHIGCSTISLESNQTKNRPETHNHTLNLEVNFMNIKEGFFCCSKCGRASCGFMYRCYEKDCKFTMDATMQDSGACCNQCDFTLKPKRATLPVLVKYKYDPHPLTLEDDYPYCMGLHPSDQDLYGCTECKTVICVECAIGKYPYLKSGITINVKGFEIETASNSSLSRPICPEACLQCIEKDIRFRPRIILRFLEPQNLK